MNKIKKLFNSLFEKSEPTGPLILDQNDEVNEENEVNEEIGVTIIKEGVETQLHDEKKSAFKPFKPEPKEELIVSKPPGAELVIRATTHQEIDNVFDGPSYSVQERSVEEIKEIPIEELRWTPNDDLWKRYQEADSIVGTIPSQLYKIKEARQKIDRKKEQANIYLNKEKITPYDRLQALELKQDIMHEEGIIDEKEQNLAQAQKLAEDPIFEEYAEYVMAATAWIMKTPEVKGIVSSRDILNSQGIYIAAKKAMDQITVSPPGKRRDEAMERLARLDVFFDLQGAHKESRAVHLLDFQKFAKDFSTAKQHLFDRLDFQIAGIDAVAKIPDRKNEEVKPVEAGTGTLHGSAPLHLQTIDNKEDQLHEILKHVPLELEDEDMNERYEEEVKKRQKPMVGLGTEVESIEYHRHIHVHGEDMGTPLSEVLGEEQSDAKKKLELLVKLKDLETRGANLTQDFSITTKLEDLESAVKDAEEDLSNQSTQDRFEAEMARRQKELENHFA